MTRTSFQDSMDWDDIMFDKQRTQSATTAAGEWDNFSTPNFNSNGATAELAMKQPLPVKKKIDKDASRKGKKESSSRSSNEPHADHSKRSSATRTSHVRSPSATRRTERKVRNDDDSNSDSDDKKKLSNVKRKPKPSSEKSRPKQDDSDPENVASSSNNKSKLKTQTSKQQKESSSTLHSPTVSRRKERKSIPVEKDKHDMPSSKSKRTIEKQSSVDDKITKRDSRKASDDVSVKRRDHSPSTRGERSSRIGISKDDDKKSKSKNEKKDRSHDKDDDTLGQSSHRRDVSIRKSRTTATNELDDTSSHTRDTAASRARQLRRNGSAQQNRPLNAEQLSQSRQRAVQRMEARNCWRDSQKKEPTTRSLQSATTLSDDDHIDARRESILDQSRRGPVRSHRYDDDDDDDFSVLSEMSSSSFMVDDNFDAPFVAKNIKTSSVAGGRGGGYLPNSLNNTNARVDNNSSFTKQERRPSAFGTGYERAQALNSLKNDLDRDSDEEGSSYALPTGLSRSAGSHFEIDRSGKGGASTRRPSLSTTLTVPCINGIDDSDNDDDLYSSKAERSGSMSSKEFDLSGSKSERRGSLRNADYDSDSNRKAGVNYDSTVEDMLKSRRLRGARGDATKKIEETKKVKKSRGLSISILSNLVHSATKSTPTEQSTGPVKNRRASTAM